jgi:hypothetical protein
MTTRRLSIVFALALAAASSTTAPSADACGSVTAEDRVDRLLTAHFASINAHDRDRLLALWNENATVVSTGDPTSIEPIDSAATRWLSTTQPVTFRDVVFDGRRLEDTVLLGPAKTGGWKIAGMSSHPLEPAAARSALR